MQRPLNLSRKANRLVVSDWPCANRRGIAIFEVCKHRAGFYGVRELEGIRRITEPVERLEIATCDQGRTYFVGSKGKYMVLIRGTMRTAHYLTHGKTFDEIKGFLESR